MNTNQLLNVEVSLIVDEGKSISGDKVVLVYKWVPGVRSFRAT